MNKDEITTEDLTSAYKVLEMLRDDDVVVEECIPARVNDVQTRVGDVHVHVQDLEQYLEEEGVIDDVVR